MSKRLINFLCTLLLLFVVSYSAKCNLIDAKYQWRKNTTFVNVYSAVSDDQKYIAESNVYGIYLFDNKGHWISQIKAENLVYGAYCTMAFSSNNKFLIFAADDGTVCGVADIQTGEVINKFKLTENSKDSTFLIKQIFDVDNEYVLMLLYNEDNSKIVKMNFSTGEISTSLYVELRKSESIQTNMIFDVNKQKDSFILFDSTGTIASYRISDFKKIDHITLPWGKSDQQNYDNIKLSQNDSIFAIRDNGYVTLFDNAKHQVISNQYLNDLHCDSYFWADNNNLILRHGNEITQFNIEEMKKVKTICNTNGLIDNIFPVENGLLISCCSRQVLYILGNDGSKTDINHLCGNIVDAKFSYDDKFMTWLTRDSTLQVYCGDNGNWIDSVSFNISQDCFDLFADSYKIIYVDQHKNIIVSNILSPSSKEYITKSSGLYNSIKISKDSKYFVSAGADSNVKIWNLFGKTILKTIKCTHKVWYSDFTNDGKKIIYLETADDENTAHLILYDFINDKELDSKVISVNISSSSLYGRKAFCYQNNTFAAAYYEDINNPDSEKRNAKVWDVGGNMINEVSQAVPCKENGAMCLSADNKYLVHGASSNGTVFINAVDNSQQDTVDLNCYKAKPIIYSCVCANNSINGYYRIFVSNGTFNGLFEYSEHLGIPDAEIKDSDFQIYPNPSHGNINIINNTSALIKTITILDLYGNTVHTESINSELRDNRININGIAPGCYFVKIASDQGICVKKIIVY